MPLTSENFPPAGIPPHAEALREEIKAFIRETLEGGRVPGLGSMPTSVGPWLLAAGSA